MEAGEEVLLDFFHSVTRNPGLIPAVPVERYPPGSTDRRLLQAFQEMLAALATCRQPVNAGYQRAGRELELPGPRCEPIAAGSANTMPGIEYGGVRTLDDPLTTAESAGLYEQAQVLAAVEERQRLARELHDSVSQALYGIALGTRTARTLLEREQAGVGEALEYIASLAAAGLAEMRALIFELRPESLETEGLVVALAKQVASLEARHRLVVRTELPAEPDLSLEAKEVLYRVAQEAMHNIVKHAQARQEHLRLEQTPSAIVLELRDDGVGSDPNGSFPGHLSLRSMRERVARLGGSLAIESAPGTGTAVRVRIPGNINIT